MPPGIVDTGFSDSLARGLQLGLQFTTAQEQREERRIERERRRQEFDAQQAQNKFNNEIRSGTLALAKGKLDRQRQAEEAAQAGNLAMFDQLDRGPDPAFQGPTTPEHPAPQTSGRLGLARAAFAAAPPATQQQMLAPTLQEMRARQAADIANTKTINYRRAQFEQAVDIINSSNVPPEHRERLLRAATEKFVGASSDEGITAAEWQQSPLFQSMTPEFQQQTLMEIQATGKFPRQLVDEWQKQALGLSPTPRLSPNDPQLFAIDTDIDAAKNEQRSAELLLNDAVTARNGYMRTIGQDFFRKKPQEYTPDDLIIVRRLSEYNKAVAAAQKDIKTYTAKVSKLLADKSNVARTLGQDQPRPRVMPGSAPPPQPSTPGQQTPTMQTPVNPAASPASAMTPTAGTGGMDDIVSQVTKLREQNPGATDDELEAMMMELLDELDTEQVQP